MGSSKSTISNPLVFFEGFFPLGFNMLYKDFLDYGKELKPLDFDNYREGDVVPPFPFVILEYNEEEDSKTVEEKIYSYLVESDSFLIKGKKKHIRNFPKELQELLNSELEKAIKYTRDGILLRNAEDQKTFVHTLFCNVANMIEHEIPFISKRKYKIQCETVLIKYLKEIALLYPYLVQSNNSIYLKYVTPKISKNTNRTLRIKEDKVKYLPVLFDKLKEGNFIEETLPFEIFKKAFDGNVIDEPLNIKWIKMLGAKEYHAVSLVKMILLLKERGWLYPYKNPQLSNIFVKNDGSAIDKNYWKTGKQDLKSAKRVENLDDIETIINDVERNL